MDALLSFNIGGKKYYSFKSEEDGENYSDEELNNSSSDTRKEYDIDDLFSGGNQIDNDDSFSGEVQVDDLFSNDEFQENPISDSKKDDFNGGCNCKNTYIYPDELQGSSISDFRNEYEVNNYNEGGNSLNNLADELVYLGNKLKNNRDNEIDEKIIFNLTKAMNDLNNLLS